MIRIELSLMSVLKNVISLQLRNKMSKLMSHLFKMNVTIQLQETQIASVDKSTPVTALQDCTYFTRKEILRWANVRKEQNVLQSWCNVTCNFLFCFVVTFYWNVTLNSSIQQACVTVGQMASKI